MITQDKLIWDRISDIISVAREKYTEKFSSFLDPRCQIIAQNCSNKLAFKNYILWGGYENATRRLFCAFSEYTQPSELVFPIVPLTLHFRKEDCITHRDVLGSIMALLVKRDNIGDILVGEGIAVVFTLENVADIIQNELKKVGRVGVKITRELPSELPQPYKLEPKEGTVSSLRLDCIIAFVLNLSRQKAVEVIKSGRVLLNYFECENISCELKQGDVFSIKGNGKFLVSEIGSQTQKGRTRLTCCKYI